MDETRKKMLIIIPAYNEEKNLGFVLEQLSKPPISEVADVLVMNDASKDRTEEVVKAYHYKVVTHIYHLGYGCGLQVGYKYAVRHGYQYLLQMDADGQHDVCNVMKIYEKLTTPDENGCCPDIILGSRYMDGWSECPPSFAKKAAYILFSWLIRIGTGKRITDPTTGLQGLNRRAFSFYAGYNHFDDQYPDANMIMQMLLLDYRLEEIPAVMHMRATGTSMHSGLKPVVYMFRMMFSILAAWLREKCFHVDTEMKDDPSV